MTTPLYVIRDGNYVLRNGKPASHIVDYDKFSKRYTDVFDEVYIVGRLFSVEDEYAKPVEGPGVSFVPLPGYRGPLQFATVAVNIFLKLRSFAKPGHAFILRIPAATPLFYGLYLSLMNIPYGVELVGDPYDALSSTSKRGLFVPIYRAILTWATKAVCRQAAAASYVTERALQLRYPPSMNALATHYTSLDLTRDAISLTARPVARWQNKRLRLISVGMMDHGLKGYDVLLTAFSILISEGRDLELECVGDGGRRAEYERLASQLGIRDKVHFTGRLSAGSEVQERLDGADVFVLASRQEGLPRALIEAMARGLPAVATAVGGADELLEPQFLAPAGDAESLSGCLRELITNPELLAEQGARNLKWVDRYRIEVVSDRRRALYSAVKASASGAR